MVTLRALTLDDAPALTRIYSGASVRHTTGRPLPLDQAQDKIRSALARAAETPRAQWSWGILDTDEMIGHIALRRRSPVMGTISYILREDTWGNGYATDAAQRVVAFAFTTVGLDRVEAMHHPANPASGRVLAKAGFTRTGTTDQPAADGAVVPYETYAIQHRTS
ncbi:ribosomal-protein-alanine N-acetyltransferase [Streptomyces sp. V4I23]|uniref:GNAT family N-acetyltransferase n=1 Tax=Streptomyces sp. V4I23 TaxID=3042282 RepID=UPI002789BAAD|nr:GNAT family N-acetyltransferase [Streptomyces sp. V4I23]MDQ1005761.1 ribosomal-protein-alanine N-acetyltransferase [Streptomyces sp. V4I23]